MKLYEALIEKDLLRPLENALGRSLLVELNGKIKRREAADHTSPWQLHSRAKDRDCEKWKLYLAHYGLPSKYCLSCWKVVFRPETLKELFNVALIQQKMGLASKCGIEKRSYTRTTGYGAYWYAPLKDGLDGGRELWKLVNKQMKETFGRGAILKRGCTEIEQQIGPSDEWQTSPGMDALEEKLDNLFEPTEKLDATLPILIPKIHRTWIEFAWQRNDPTVWDFADKSSFPAGPVTYERSVHSGKDFPISVPKGDDDGEGSDTELQQAASRICRLSS